MVGRGDLWSMAQGSQMGGGGGARDKALCWAQLTRTKKKQRVFSMQAQLKSMKQQTTTTTITTTKTPILNGGN